MDSTSDILLCPFNSGLHNINTICLTIDPTTMKKSKNLKGHLAPRVSHIMFLGKRVMPGSL